MTIFFHCFLCIFLSISLPFFLHIFFSFVKKKNIHRIQKLHFNSHHHTPPLAANAKDVMERSETVEPAMFESFAAVRSTGFMDEAGGNIGDGLIDCTESLGSESSNERRADCGTEEINNGGDDDRGCRRVRTAEDGGRWRREKYRRHEATSFPPPLSSLNPDGRPRFYLRPVRKDGRLQLVGARIHRPEILRASRENGRLRLHLVTDDQSFLDDLEEEEEEEEDEEEQQRKEDERLRFHLAADGDLQEDATETVEEGKKEVGEIRYKSESNLGMMTCHEMVNHHHHHRVDAGHHPHHMRICGVTSV